MTQKLTKSIVDRLVYRKERNERCVIWDTLLPGFGVRVYPSGHKAFILSYRVRGRKRLLTLGMYGALTLDRREKQSSWKNFLPYGQLLPNSLGSSGG